MNHGYPLPLSQRQSGLAAASASSRQATVSSAAAVPYPHGEPESSSSSQPVVLETADRILSRARGDEKYWAQICHAHDLVSNCVGTELAMTEAMSRGESVLEPIFRDALEAQEMDRLNAVTMLAVLRELVTLSDGERLAAVSSRLGATTAAEATPQPQQAGKRARSDADEDDDEEEEEADRHSPDSLQGDSEAVASLSLATSPVPASPPLLATPPQSPPPALPASSRGAKKQKAVSPVPGSPPPFSGGIITPPRSPPPVAASLPASLRASPAVSVGSSASTHWTPQVTPERPRRMSAGGLAPDHADSVATPEPPERPIRLSTAAVGAGSDEKDAAFSKRKKVGSYDAAWPLSAVPIQGSEAGRVPWAMTAAPARGSSEFRS